MSRDVLYPAVAQVIARIKGSPTPHAEIGDWITPDIRQINPTATLVSTENLLEIEALFSHAVLSR